MMSTTADVTKIDRETHDDQEWVYAVFGVI